MRRHFALVVLVGVQLALAACVLASAFDLDNQHALEPAFVDTSSLAYQSGGSVGASAGSESSNDDDDPDADKPAETSVSGDGKMDSRGKNKVYTDKNGHHYIFLTNKNTLIQNMPTNGKGDIRKLSAAEMTKHLIELAKKKAAAKIKMAEEINRIDQQKTKDNKELAQAQNATQQIAKADKEKADAALKANLAVTLSSPAFKQFGGDYQEVSATRLGDICVLQGVVKGTAGMVATLGPACRPADGRLIFSTMRADLPCRVDILPDGRVYIIATSVDSGDSFLSLSGIAFTTTVKDNIQLLNNWVDYADGFRGVSILKQGDLCIVSGLIRSGNWNQPFARLPTECYPTDRLIFNLNNHAYSSRVDIVNTGHIVWAGGRADHSWISLDGLVWAPGTGGINLDLNGKWQQFGQGYRVGRYVRVGDLCMLSGVIKNEEDWSEIITTLPAACRPAARQIFTVSVHTASARIDVLSSGSVVYMAGKTKFSWLPLDGVRFVVAPAAST